jgi:hypothetical protein
MFNIAAPLDEDGNPLVLIGSSIEETIPTAKYANVKVGDFLFRWVKDENLDEQIQDNYQCVENALKVQHEEILEELEKGN